VLEQRAEAVELPGEVLRPGIGDEVVAAARSGAEAALGRALAHEVELSHPEGTWTTSPQQLGAVADGELLVTDALDLALTDGDLATLPVALDIPDAAVDGLVAEMAAALDVRPVNATVDWSGGTVRRLAGQEGRALDRDATATALRDALAGGNDAIELSVDATAPGRGVGALRDVLVVHQSQTRVDLYRGDDLVRSWPVAVGTGGSPTPTGTFVVGAKRFEPTWVNPALDRWGSDMPERIGPGPDNPLGLRALNWNRDGGGDTLIRFHGTPNEASIGSASSNGCVRMFNADVIELYDMVSSGTMIISLA
jgi:lipoprotein-anchoring transpeptidase ErfK/SrfK